LEELAAYEDVGAKPCPTSADPVVARLRGRVHGYLRTGADHYFNRVQMAQALHGSGLDGLKDLPRSG
jgi:hypothetical protein